MFRPESSTSNNPIYFLGTYIGIAAGLVLYLKGWHPFWWLPPLFGINTGDLVILDMLGGGLVGYIAHVIYRVCRGSKEAVRDEKIKVRDIKK
jgi:hypothetical protein